MKKIAKLVSVASLALALSPLTASADTLLVISSSGGMFGDKNANTAMEHFGAAMAVEALKKDYRRVVTWYATGGPEIEAWARQVVATQQPGEPIDVFALEHGQSSFLPGVQAEVVESIFPKGMVRRLFSSGCSNWGRFTSAPDGSGIKTDRWGFTEHMTRMGVQEYVIHANDNSTGPLSYPLLAAEFRRGGSWLEGGKRAFENEDDISAEAVPQFLQLEGPIKRFAKYLSLPLGLNGAREAVREFFHSRPVFGGTKFPEKASLFDGRNMLEGDDAKIEAMLPPTAELAKVLKLDVPNAFNNDPTPSDPTEAATGPSGPVIAQTLESADQGIMAALQLASRVVDIYAENDQGCIDPKVMQPLMDVYLKTAQGKTPELKSFCLKRKNDSTYEIKWVLGGTGKFHLPGMDVWDIALPEGVNSSTSGMKIRSLFMRRHGSLTVYVRKHDGRTGFKLSGLGIKAEGIQVTKKFKVPSGVMHFSLRGGWINEQGHFIAKVGTWLFGARVGIEGNLQETGARIDDLNIAGIKIKLHM